MTMSPSPRPFELHLTGTSTLSLPPERAILEISVQTLNPKRNLSISDALRTSQTLCSLLSGPAPSAAGHIPATESWTKSPLACNAQQEMRSSSVFTKSFRSRINFTITFAEAGFSTIGKFVAQVSRLENVEFGGLRWCLTDQTKKLKLGELRRGAARDAREKAESYCGEFGLERIRPVELKEGKCNVDEVTVGVKPEFYGEGMGVVGKQAATAATTTVGKGIGLVGLLSGGKGEAGSIAGTSAVGKGEGWREVKGEEEEESMRFPPLEVKMDLKVEVVFHAE